MGYVKNVISPFGQKIHLNHFVLNIYDNMIYQICMKKMYKDETLLYSCGITDNNNPLLPFQYSIVNYGVREKSSILEFDRPFFINFSNLRYNIFKSLKDKSVRELDFPELDSCSKCDNDILMSPFKAFSYLMCGHIFHRLCIKKKLFLDALSICPASNCKKSVDILNQADVFSIIFNLLIPDPKMTSQLAGILPI